MPSLIGGGAEKTLINLLSIIDYNTFDVTVCVVLNKGIYFNKLPKNVRVVTLFNNELITRVLFKLHQKFNFIFPIKYFFKFKIGKCNYDFGICFLDGITTELLNDHKLFKKKITWVHSCYKSFNNFYKFYSNKKYVSRLIEQRYKVLDSIVFVSKDSKDEFIEIFGSFNDMPVIYNPISSEEVLRKSNHNSIFTFKNTNVFKFVAVGSLSPVKNYDFLIDSVFYLIKTNNKFIVYVLGTGYLEDKLKEKVSSLKLNNYIHFLGFSDNPYCFIKSCDVFVMASKSEALPTAMIEAMVLGKPVLTTNVSGCREVVMNGEYGLLADNSPKNFASLMDKLISDKETLNHFKIKSLERAKDFTDCKFLESFYKLLEVDNTAN